MRTGRLTAAVATAAMLLATAGCLGPDSATSSAGTAGPVLLPSSAAPSSTTPSSSTPSTTAPSTTGASTTAPSATAATSAAETATPAPTKSPARLLAAELNTVFGTGSSYSVAVLDLTTGRSARAGAGGGMLLASLVKLDILETLLYQRQRNGQGVRDGADADVEAMIEHSDNGAADRLFRRIGRETGMGGYNSVLGLHHTVLNTEGLWGLSTTSADDQLILLQALASERSPLNAASRQYALGLMGQVESDQRWGVSAAADPNSNTPLKNGWLGVDDDNGLWAVNSAGIVRVGGHQLLMVVLSQHQPDFSTAVDRVQRAAVKLAAAL